MNIDELRKEPHWSYSALQCYISCPLKYRFRYIDNAEPERTGSCFPFGRAFHAALSKRARGGKQVSVKEVNDVFEDFFSTEVKATDNLVFKPAEDYDTMLQTGFKMIEAACNNWIDDFAVQSVAEGFSVSIPGLSRPFIGEFDCIVTDGRDTCIVDWKTASAKWPVGKADKDLQATAFCYAFREKYNEKPLFRFDVITKAKSPTVNNYYTLRTDDELNRFISLINQIDKCVASGNFYPNETGFSCTDCPYADRCKKWR